MGVVALERAWPGLSCGRIIVAVPVGWLSSFQKSKNLAPFFFFFHDSTVTPILFESDFNAQHTQRSFMKKKKEKANRVMYKEESERGARIRKRKRKKEKKKNLHLYFNRRW